jgi:hypothetical protein
MNPPRRKKLPLSMPHMPQFSEARAAHEEILREFGLISR